jgi:ribosomal protein S18 acetylase RimI-like enzyme
MDETIRVCAMEHCGEDVRAQMAEVFVEAYLKDLSSLSRDKEVLQKLFQGALCANVFFYAELKGEVVGILACANNKNRGLNLQKAHFVQYLGRIRGSFFYRFMRKELSAALDYPDDTAYIECVATKEAYRGRGVATALIRHAISKPEYRAVVLDVTDTNDNAYRLYKRLGFTPFKRERVRFSGLKGFREKIYMRLEKPQSESKDQ